MAGRAFFIALIAISGAGLALQQAMNGRLRTTSGSPVLAATISFAVGLLMLCLILQVASYGDVMARLSTLREAPWWAFGGGAVGCTFVMLGAAALSRIGPAATMTAAITGQIIGSLLLEQFGWLGVTRNPVTVLRLFGAFLLLTGMILVQYRPSR